MKVIGEMDSVFEILFARYRRKMGDINVEYAWRRASNKVSGLLIVAVIALYLLGLLILDTSTTESEQIAANSKTVMQLIGGALAIGVGIMLDRRFRKFLTNLRPMAPVESRAEMWRVRRFATVTVGLFVATCFVAIMMHIANS